MSERSNHQVFFEYNFKMCTRRSIIFDGPEQMQAFVFLYVARSILRVDVTKQVISCCYFLHSFVKKQEPFLRVFIV